MTARAVSVAKAGHGAHENEDAWATAGTRAAVADGATETAFAGAWARHLARAACASPALLDAIAHARASWPSHLAPLLVGQPWFVQAKADEGAFAAVLVVQVEGREVRAEAVGDANLFVLGPREVRRAWPYEDAEAFGMRPALVGTAGDVPPVQAWRTRLGTDESLLLATDALAAYVLRTGALPEAFWTAPEHAVDQARRQGLRNDDVTALLLT